MQQQYVRSRTRDVVDPVRRNALRRGRAVGSIQRAFRSHRLRNELLLRNAALRHAPNDTSWLGNYRRRYGQGDESRRLLRDRVAISPLSMRSRLMRDMPVFRRWHELHREGYF